jgi:hypothetical protein
MDSDLLDFSLLSFGTSWQITFDFKYHTIHTYSLNCLRQINSRLIEITTKATKQVQNILIIVGLQNNKHNIVQTSDQIIKNR